MEASWENLSLRGEGALEVNETRNCGCGRLIWSLRWEGGS